MNEATEQQKANLARIRDNQRRSRARRKEYLQELEGKYRSCEAVGAEASAEIQAAARKVLDENKRLRRLLRQQGLTDLDIDGPDYDENASSPTAAEMLGVMLVTRKPCRPSAGGDKTPCKGESSDTESRRQSCASTPAAPPQQQPLPQPIALAPAPPPLAIAPSPQSQSSPPQHQHQRQQQSMPQQAQHQPAPQHPQQPQQPIHYQSHAIQQQHAQQQQPHQQFYMTPPTQSTATPSHVTNAQPPTNTYIHDYPIYAPQPYGFTMPSSQLLDWDMTAMSTIPHQQQPYTSPPDQAYASPISAYSTNNLQSYPANNSQPTNTSSCFVAADAIRSMHAGAGPEVETALGCRDGVNDCRVDNKVVFDVMDHYASHPGM